MQTRMQPIGTLFQRFPRVVRDLAGKLGKRCRLDTRRQGRRPRPFDPRSAQRSADAPRAQRRRPRHGDAGRTPWRQEGSGRVSFSSSAPSRAATCASPSRTTAAASILRALRKKAVEKGVITAAQRRTMRDREAIHLIFAPGFSTAEKVTDVSGRGVGMDVVRSNIEKSRRARRRAQHARRRHHHRDHDPADPGDPAGDGPAQRPAALCAGAGERGRTRAHPRHANPRSASCTWMAAKCCVCAAAVLPLLRLLHVCWASRMGSRPVIGRDDRRRRDRQPALRARRRCSAGRRGDRREAAGAPHEGTRRVRRRDDPRRRSRRDDPRRDRHRRIGSPAPGRWPPTAGSASKEPQG
jgi:hypothetical protein